MKRECALEDELRAAGILAIAARIAPEAERFVEAVGDVLVPAAPEDDCLGARRPSPRDAAPGEGAPDAVAPGRPRP